jgi:transaldolase
MQKVRQKHVDAVGASYGREEHVMKFFIDTADLDEISEAMSWGVLSGVTTNPSLYCKTGGKLADFEAHMGKICKICEGLPVSAESTAKTAKAMIAEGEHLHEIAPNIVVKLPVCTDGLAATHALAQEGIPVNMTLVFSAPQALLAARAGARYVSPFVGRFDDIGEDGIEELATIVQCIHNYDFGHEVEIITASVRTPNHVTQAALMGADIATVPFGALGKCIKHPLTDQGLERFDADWKKVVEG